MAQPPEPGDVVTAGGKQYRYDGGDPSARESWNLVTTSNPSDRSAMANALAQAGTARRTADTANQFLQRNRATGTGGIQSVFADKGPVGAVAKTAAGWLFPHTYQNISTMDALTGRMLRDNIAPGTASTLNSEGEMRVAMSTLPSVNNPGPTNTTLAHELDLAAKIAEAKSQAMDAYVRTNGGLNGFDQSWAPQEQRLRATRPPAPRPAPTPTISARDYR